MEVPEEDFEDDDFERKTQITEAVDQLEEAARVTKEYLEKASAKTYGAEATVTVEARQ